jgi:protein O-GlcNAc transferase
MDSSPFKSKQARQADAANLLARAAALHQRGALAEAEPVYRQALSADPKNFDALHLLGVVVAQRGNASEGHDLLRRALQINPGSAEAHINIGRVLIMLDRQEEALVSFDKALNLEPANLLALTNRGATLVKLNRPEEALTSYDQALAVKSDHVEALYNRGNALNVLGRHAEALASFDRVLGLQPRHARALTGRANALRSLGRLDEAVESLDKALAADGTNMVALANRGHILSDLRRYDEALASYERVLGADPAHPTALAGFAFAAISVCDFARSETLRFQLEGKVRDGTAAVPPFTFLSLSGDAALQRQCAEAAVRTAFSPAPPPLWRGEVRPHDRIRLAYLSADFRAHATSYLIAELLEGHDRARFEVIAVSTGADDGSETRARIVRAVDQFHDVQARSDAEIARLLFDLQADIVVDLNVHTMGGRLGILARRPAPVQISYLGFPGTSGADFIDYIIVDETLVPPDHQAFFSEKVVYLPDTYALRDTHTKVAARFPTRREAALPDRGIVFCCFNNNYKIAPPVFDVWMRLLRAVRGSVLWLLQDNATAEANLRKEAFARGIDPVRLVFAPRVPHEDHLARHRLADLFLDTVPVNAHTTASDALWMGVPVVTCLGSSFVGRVAASVTRAAGLPELVTGSLAEYEALALGLANEPSRLEELRMRLRSNRSTSALFDAARQRQNLEAAYVQAWTIRQRGGSPESFPVTGPLPRTQA